MPKTEILKKVREKTKPAALNYEGPLKKAISIAEFYGFNLIEPPNIKGNFKRAYKEDDFFVPVDIKSFLIKKYFEGEFNHFGPTPLICYTSRNPNKKTSYLHLEVLGSSKSIAEGIILRTTLSIAKDLKAKNLSIGINNVGDKEAFATYTKELSNFYKKNAANLDARCRNLLKKDVLKLLSCENDKCLELKGEAPKPLSYLGDAARSHFKEVIEFVENLDTIYQIESGILSNPDYSNKTIFEIKEFAKEEDLYSGNNCQIMARGARYDGLAKKLGFKKTLPSVGISIKFDNVSSKESYKKIGKISKPKVYLIQFGFAAKLRALKVIEIFRENKIAFTHSLLKDDLGSQLQSAERSGANLVAIVGQKEVVDNTVMIRNVANRSQDSIAMAKVGSYIKEELKHF